ncbi:MFS transporter [Marinomonas agarivorans]|nr:MFS transporter [Marinomonas agarivorans]
MIKLALSDLMHKETLSLLSSSALIGIAGAFIVTTLSLFLFQEVGVSALFVGIFFAVRAIAEICADLIIGYLSENRYQRQHIAILCTLLSGGGAVLLMLVRDYYLLMLGSVVLFGLGGAIFPQLFALTRDVADSKGINVNVFNALIRAMTSISWVIGPPVAFLLIDITSFAFLYGIAAFCYFSAVFILLAGRFNLHQGHNKKTSFQWQSLNFRTYRILVFVLLLLTVVMIYQINIALYISQELQLATSVIGWVVGIGSALEIPFMLLFGFLANHLSKQGLLLFAALNAGGFFILLSLSQSVTALILIQIPNAIWVSIVLSLPIVMLQDELQQFHGMASSLFSSAFKFGTFFGGAVGGLLLSYLGFQQTFLLCSLLAILAGCAIIYHPRKDSSHAV